MKKITVLYFILSVGMAHADNVPVRLTFDHGNERLPAWDPRGDIIAFGTDRNPGDWYDIGAVNADGTNERLLATGIQSPFGLAAGPLSWVGSTGMLMTPETINFHEYLAFDVSQAPFTRTTFNGNDAAFTVKLGIDGGGGGSLFLVSRDGSTALWRYSASGGGGLTSIRTAPYASLAGQGASSLGTIHVSDNVPFPQQWYFTAAISSDGSFFLLTKPAGSGMDLWYYKTDGSEAPFALTTSGQSSGALNQLPDISPDGTKIVFTFGTGLPGYSNDIFMMDADGGNVRNLTNTVNLSEAWPTWAPDGKAIAFGRADNQNSPDIQPGEPNNTNIYRLQLSPGDDEEDPDNDGFVNLLERAFFMNENVPDPHLGADFVTVEEMGTDYPGFKYRRQSGGDFGEDFIYSSADFLYTVEVSTSLEEWGNPVDGYVFHSVTDNGDGSETAVIRFDAPFPAGDEMFIRVRVERR